MTPDEMREKAQAWEAAMELLPPEDRMRVTLIGARQFADQIRGNCDAERAEALSKAMHALVPETCTTTDVIVACLSILTVCFQTMPGPHSQELAVAAVSGIFGMMLVRQTQIMAEFDAQKERPH